MGGISSKIGLNGSNHNKKSLGAPHTYKICNIANGKFSLAGYCLWGLLTRVLEKRTNIDESLSESETALGYF